MCEACRGHDESGVGRNVGWGQQWESSLDSADLKGGLFSVLALWSFTHSCIRPCSSTPHHLSAHCPLRLLPLLFIRSVLVPLSPTFQANSYLSFISPLNGTCSERFPWQHSCQRCQFLLPQTLKTPGHMLQAQVLTSYLYPPLDWVPCGWCDVCFIDSCFLITWNSAAIINIY